MDVIDRWYFLIHFWCYVSLCGLNRELMRLIDGLIVEGQEGARTMKRTLHRNQSGANLNGPKGMPF